MRRPWLGLTTCCLLLAAACADPVPGATPPPEELREQIHAATGHEPTSCTDFRGSAAEIEITTTGFSPECLIVSAGSRLTVVNNDFREHSLTVSDPTGNLVVRHIRVDAALQPGDEYLLDPVDSLLGVGIYPFWSKGDQQEGFTGSLIVRS
jgi:plastocyanin